MHTTQESDIRIVKQEKNKIITPTTTTTTPTVNQNKMSAASTIATNPASQKPFAPAAVATTATTVTTPTNSPAKAGPGAVINANTNGFNNNKPNPNQTTPTAAAAPGAVTATPKAPANTINNNNNNNSTPANSNVKPENKTPAQQQQQQPNKNPNANNNNNNNNGNKHVVNNMNKNAQNNNNNNNNANKNPNATNNNNKNNANQNAGNKNNAGGANANNQQKNGQNPNANNNNKGNFNAAKNENKQGGPNNQNKFQNGHHNDKSKEQNAKQNQGNPNNANNSNINSQAQTSGYGEKKFTGRCRLFVGNLPSDITEKEFSELFTKFGDVGECFLNTQRSFGFVKLDTRLNAEHAKQELDGHTLKGRCIRVRFASHGAAVKVKNLSPYISNEYLEQAFSMFGPVERAVVIVDDKGRPTGDGIVEFERKPAATQCINKCTESFFILTGYPKPVIVEPLEQKDDEDGLPEKSIIKNNQFYTERETGPHFAPNGSYEQKLAMRWRELYELEKQIQEDGRKRIEQAREMLEYEVDQALIDQRTLKLKEDLRMKQEELQRMEEMRKTELQRRQDMEFRYINTVFCYRL
jgi:non-POU domain-containing octamer-binding protein